MAERPSDLAAEASGPTWRGRSASAPSSTPTFRPNGCGTTSSTGTACWPSRATPARTCSTRTPASAPSSAGPRCPRPTPGTRPLIDRAAGARPGPAAARVLRRGRGHGGRGLQPGQALHLPVRPGLHLHDLLRGLPGPGRRRGCADVTPGAVRPDGPGARPGALPPRHGGTRADVTAPGRRSASWDAPVHALSSARHISRPGPRGAPTKESKNRWN